MISAEKNIRTDMPHYTPVIDACFEKNIGIHGLKCAQFEVKCAEAAKAFAAIGEKVKLGQFPILNHLESEADLDEIIRTGEHIRERFDELVVLGTGGSTLNPQCLSALAQPHDMIDRRVYFVDSVDPYTIEVLIQQLDLPSTAFLVTSKSGKTVESQAQCLTFLAALQKSGVSNPGEHFFMISDPGDNPLRRIGKEIGATMLDHIANIGGRFSSFTNVGLLPALVAGVDIRRVRAGAKAAMEDFFSNPMSAPVTGAALQVAFMEQGATATVVMPYIDRLYGFTTWFRQIWAESLGKQGKGTTPIRAIGALDQHSQLQLYLDGPKDKFFTVITLDTRGQGASMPKTDIPYLSGKTVGDVNAALQQATIETLANNGCPVRHIQLAAMNEETLAALMVHFMLETIITADLLGLNAFDQPAVEEGKVLARRILGE